MARIIKDPRDGKVYRWPSSNRELKRYLLEKGISGNTVKWLGFYDIAVPEQPGNLIPTGLRTIDALTFEEWEALFRKAAAGETWLR